MEALFNELDTYSKDPLNHIEFIELATSGK